MGKSTENLVTSQKWNYPGTIFKPKKYLLAGETIPACQKVTTMNDSIQQHLECLQSFQDSQ